MHRSIFTAIDRARSAAFALACRGVDRTKQAFRDECDINKVVARWRKTGVIFQTKAVPLEGDFSNGLDYRELCDMKLAAERSFMSLPSSVRDRFGHDPGKFVEWCSNKENAEEMIKLGLASKVEKPPVPPPVEVKIVGDKPPEDKK